MRHVLVTSNSRLVQLFKSRPAHRLGLTLHVGTSGLDVLANAEKLQPVIIALDADLPEVDGYTVCEKLKASRGLKNTRIMLVTSDILDQAALKRCIDSRCDYVFILPTDPEDFATSMAELLNLQPRNSRRVAANLLTRVESDTGVWTGTIHDLSLTGAKLELDRPLTAQDEVTVLLKQGHGSAGKVINARVVWAEAEDCTAGVEFIDLSSDVRRAIDSLVFWEAVRERGTLRITIEGDLTENTDFTGLDKGVTGPVIFDLSGVRRINSFGTRLWVEFIRRLDGKAEYTFSRCSVAFTTMASLVEGALGRGRMVSFTAPFECESCSHEEEHVIETAAFLADRSKQSKRSCSQCDGAMFIAMGFETALALRGAEPK